MNIVIRNSPYTSRDIEILFENEEVRVFDDTDMSRLAVELGAFKSTSQARRSGRSGPIPKGWTEWKVSKKQRAWIWNPSN